MSRGKSKGWQEYQDRVASLFHAAGCDAKADEIIEGARAKHKVDVRVIFNKYGISCLWIIECKFWNGRVTKEKVMALKAIVDDCGADRGLIISKQGFQSGAVRASYKSNITLSSVEQLQEYINDKEEEIEELQRRLATVEGQLGEYRCPHCGSELVSRQEIDYDEHNSGLVETFECGFQTGGWYERPCPFSINFPRIEDFDLTIFSESTGPAFRYGCAAIPKTDKARNVQLKVGYGRTADEAREAVIEHYNYLITPPGQEFRGKWIQRSGYKKA
ncbi:MAG: restriction endonuclease [Methylocella sp.]